MAKLIVSNIVSLDGYCAGAGGNPLALPMDGAFNDYNAERLRSAGTLLLGRTTFEMFRGFWPQVTEDTPMPPVVKEIARLNAAIPKWVASDTLQLEPGSAWSDATVVRRAELHERIAALKASAEDDVLVFGSHLLWNGLLAAGLVDELHLMVGNVVLGEGVRAFEQAVARPLRVIGERRFAESQNVLIQYAVDA